MPLRLIPVYARVTVGPGHRKSVIIAYSALLRRTRRARPLREYGYPKEDRPRDHFSNPLPRELRRRRHRPARLLSPRIRRRPEHGHRSSYIYYNSSTFRAHDPRQLLEDRDGRDDRRGPSRLSPRGNAVH